MDEPTDAALMQGIVGGERPAFERLLARHSASVNRYILRMVGNRAEAEDITQEVFLRAWTRAAKYDARVARLSTWLHRIAHNLCIDHFRRQRPSEDIDESGDLASNESPERDLLAEDVARAVRAAIAALPERQRSALLMCHYQGLSNREAADILELSVDALESLLARGRRKLKERLEADDARDPTRKTAP